MSKRRRQQSVSTQPGNSTAVASSTDKSAEQRSPATTDSPSVRLAAAILAVAIGIVYARSLTVPLVLDDTATVSLNTSIRSLWPLVGTEEHPGPLNASRDFPTAGRPLVNYSFALNYYLGGQSVVGYHFISLALHFSCALLLFAIVRRVLRLPRFAGQFDSVAGWLALVTAILWSVHPLLIDAVAYITQRTELMMAFFYLATIYCSLRYWSLLSLGEGGGDGALDLPHTNQRPAWLVLAVLACLGGMLSKEVMVSAPIVVLVFERTFFTRSFAAALRRSWPLYVGLAATWIPLVILSTNSPRSSSSGFHLCDNVMVYWFTQCKVLLMYLKLAVWPWPLRCAYELPKVDSIATFFLYVVPVLLMSALAIVLLWRNHPAGFVFFFVGAILAPTSIVPIMTEMAAERRMYLPLAALIALAVVGIYSFLKRQSKQKPVHAGRAPASESPLVVGVLSVAAIGIIYGIMTMYRLGDYYNETLMWQQVAETQPYNHGAHYNLGLLYNHAGREAESMAEFEAAVAAKPDFKDARSALGFALITAGRLPEAIESLKAALAIEPEYVPALNNMGIAYTKLGQYPEAIEFLERAVRIAPNFVQGHINLSKAYAGAGRSADAMKQLQTAESLVGEDPDSLYDLATILVANNEPQRAIALLERAVDLRPDFANAHNRLGIALAQAGNPSRAIVHFRRLMKLNPSDPSAYFNSANAAAALGDYNQAASLYTEAVRLRPDSPEARLSLAGALAQVGRLPEAVHQFQKSLELNPSMLSAYAPLAAALASANRGDEAVQVAQRGIEVARAAGDATTAAQLQDWLARFQSGAAKQ